MDPLLKIASDLLKNALSTAAVLGLLVYLARNFFTEWVQNYFGERTQKRLKELEDKLEKERSELSEIRQFFISGTNGRNHALLVKQISAADALWTTHLSDKRHLMLIKFMQVLNLEEMNDAVKSGKAADMVETLSKVSGLEKFIDELENMTNEEKSQQFNLAAKQRPFVSPLAWALYHAHSSITSHAVVTMFSWKNGIDTSLLKNDELLNTAKKALPHQTAFVEEYGVSGTYFLLDEIEQKLLDEIRRFLRAGETDNTMAAQAREILRVSEAASASTLQIKQDSP